MPHFKAILFHCIVAPFAAMAAADPLPDPLGWPAITKDNMPGTRWWWMGSAVNPTDLARELKTFREAGIGTVEITPIYGVHGAETQFIDYLSPKWMEMLKVTTSEARKLDMNVDMASGTGWCFGGPNVSDDDANATAVYNNGSVTQKPSGVKVKRPAPGGEGWMLNLLYPDAMDRYLQPFTTAFSKYDGPKLHAQFHDSYEYKSDWAPDFPSQFAKRRGYDLTPELSALFENKGDPEHVARVKSDYRETVSDLIEESVARWTAWTHSQGSLSRNQAHGSPGNWLDIYAASDIPETEMFYKDRDILVAKFASSAAHVTGKNLVGAETGTWVAEHFTETLADLKTLVDDMFLAGVNRITWHGTAYSPADAPWPGWCFYASTEMNPRNAIWRDVPALNTYIARVQSVLQSGRPDNDILLYWPIHDLWHNADGLVQPMSVHIRDWFDGQSIGKTAHLLWDRGYTFDYVSDKQLQAVKNEKDGLHLFGNKYRVIVVPECEHMPLETLQKLLSLAEYGATIVFQNNLPKEVPGTLDLETRRSAFQSLLASIKLADVNDDAVGTLQQTVLGTGCVIVDKIEPALSRARASREEMVDIQGLHFVRRALNDGFYYFIANRGGTFIDEQVILTKLESWHSFIMNPMNGEIGGASLQAMKRVGSGFRLQLMPGESVIVRNTHSATAITPWPYRKPTGAVVTLNGIWKVDFLEGGPKIPTSVRTNKLGSWAEFGGEDAQSFAGTARYTLTFDAPQTTAEHWTLDLGKVCQSARVRLNGTDLGTLIIAPFRVSLDHLKPKGNLLEIEVTSTSANRIRDLDIRKVPWKIFYDTNIVNLGYKPFDASPWPLAGAGLLGPVTLQAQSGK